MTSKYVQPGNVLDYTAGSAVTNGQVLLVGKRLAVALVAIAAGAVGSVAVTGVYAIAKKAGDAPAQGDLLYWDAANNYLTTTVGSNTLAGFAAAAAAGGDATVNLKLNG
ncbi:DUF2190 family protein [Dechloromonas sp. TW-R-39-2]|uniref:DUF2190 family protein n=1 Tax=Dechloromonas sp. TW-R-39-2 TaxID=2654218 RepID=UPI00193DAE94|nr:DUF2190 family protein [Dechloromonas sp. TW-R-39-2]QRM19555.1 DUF2190 family protein [Dechloromonas sp. TW-R-39-2]